MLKKAGIIVAASAAALLAASPLAFASPTYDHSPKCTFQASNNNSVTQAGTGILATLAGIAGAAANTAAPINAQAQAPIGSCNNVQDVLNVTDTTTNINKSKNHTVTNSKTKNSNNTLLGGLPIIP